MKIAIQLRKDTDHYILTVLYRINLRVNLSGTI